jgi:hypothetical protein
MQMQKQRQTSRQTDRQTADVQFKQRDPEAQELLDSEILDEIDEALEGLDEQLGKTYRQAGGE